MMMGNERTSEMEMMTHSIGSYRATQMPASICFFFHPRLSSFLFFVLAFIPGARSISMGLIVDVF